MQKLLQWLDDHSLLDPLERALGIVGFILFIIWCCALAVAGLFILIFTIWRTAWWLLAIIPWLLLLVATVTFYYYIDQIGG
jgi:quinol-cytochrome oxidoreductase complex cytochrome b subunit